MAELTANDIVLGYEHCESERENLDGQFELIERFVMPGKGRFFQEGHDEEQSIDWTHREIYDGTAQNALVLLTASLHGSLTSASVPWFSFRFRSDELNDNQEASAWLEDCAERVNSSLQDSNFALEVNEFYQDAAGYGTAVMLHDEITEGVEPLTWGGHRFRSEMQRQCYFEEGWHRQPIRLYIKRSYTPRQLADKFGIDALPEKVRQKVEQPDKGVAKDEDVIYCIYEDMDNRGANVSGVLPTAARPFKGRYVLVEGREFLGDEEGFYEFPGYILRWQRTAGSKYGHCPGLIALGDILTLQEQVRDVRASTKKTVDPPMKSTRRGIIGDLDLRGGGVTFVRDMEALAPLMPPNAYRVETGWQDIQDLRSRIEKYFFVDQLQIKESPAMTAYEVQIRYEMMQRLLGPTLGRIQSDFLDPLVRQSFYRMYRKGALEEPPEVVKQNADELDIEYVGPLARAQRMSTIDSIQRWLDLLGGMAQVVPEVTDLPDADAIGNYSADVLGVPAKLLNSETKIKRKRKQRQELARQQAQMEQLTQVAGAAKDMGAAAGGMGAGAAPPQEGAA